MSKTMIETQPATLILGGSIQKIFHHFSCQTARMTPEVMAAGRAGGMAMVIRSMNLLKVIQAERYFSETGKLASIPIKAMNPRAQAKRRESLWNLNLEGRGNKILLTRSPFVVSYPVLVTTPSAFSAPALVQITSVPLNKVCFLSVSGS